MADNAVPPKGTRAAALPSIGWERTVSCTRRKTYLGSHELCFLNGNNKVLSLRTQILRTGSVGHLPCCAGRAGLVEHGVGAFSSSSKEWFLFLPPREISSEIMYSRCFSSLNVNPVQWARFMKQSWGYLLAPVLLGDLGSELWK